MHSGVPIPERRHDKRLARTYSETEANNFDAETGHRLFDDGRIRPSRTALPARPAIPRLYSRSHNSDMDQIDGAYGLEDEYIPGLDFGAELLRWNATPDALALVSREALYLDLNTLHAQVAPQPIGSSAKKHRPGFSTPSPKERMRVRRARALQQNVGAYFGRDLEPARPALRDNIREGMFAGAFPSLGARTALRDNMGRSFGASAATSLLLRHSFDAVAAALPKNFAELPYSQRKRLVKQVAPAVDFAHFSAYSKSVGSAGGIRLRRGSTSMVLRRGSTSMALRVAALLLSAELTKLVLPKTNVDEKGAVVLNHTLGKIIGFGAWGTIRECTACDGSGVVRAVKIVRSVRDADRAGGGPRVNAKVLAVFRNEIAIWSQTHHRNILPLHDHVETPDAIFCLTDRIGGGTLFEVAAAWGPFNDSLLSTSGPLSFSLARHRRRIATTAAYGRQIALALRYLHDDLGVVHGDLKLENVLVDNSDPASVRMVLCDFGMSRVYAPRLARQASRVFDESAAMARSKSSFVAERRPYDGDSPLARSLFADDSKIGILNLSSPHGPALPSIDLTPCHLRVSAALHEFALRTTAPPPEIESDLPHLHIGLLPYASPELLSPLPPPLGPSADIWAFGVLLYTMVVGRLPFQHLYEPRLRAMISAGKYDRPTMRQACLMEWLLPDEPAPASSFVDVSRQSQLDQLRRDWDRLDHAELSWVDEMVEGCLERDITRRWDLDMVLDALTLDNSGDDLDG